VQQSTATGGDIERRHPREHLAADEPDAVLAGAAAVSVGTRDEVTLDLAVEGRRRAQLFVGQRLTLRQDGDDGVRAVVLQTRQVVGRVEQVQAVDLDARAHLVAPVAPAQPQSVVPARTHSSDDT